MKIVNNPVFKIITMLLLYYAFIAGMLRPLNPGIMELSSSNARTGEEIELTVHTYNTHLKGKDNKAFLKLDDDSYITATEFAPLSDQSAAIRFQIPGMLPGKARIESSTLIISNPEDGTFIRPSAIAITRDSVSAPATGQWQQTGLSGLYSGEATGFPFRLILEETIRNIYYHVPLWFAMFFLFFIAAIYAVIYLRKENSTYLDKSYALNRTGFIFGLLGILTGAVWAKYTWGTYWTGDIKLNMTAIAMLIYAAYFILWQSFQDEQVRGRVSAVYSIFAFIALIPLIFVIPRMYDSLHPGNGGNPALGGEDLDNTMRLVFYPAVIGFIMLGLWISHIGFRLRRIHAKLSE